MTKTNQEKNIYLISCVKGKSENPAAAGELYQSLWFKSARAYVQKRNAEWFILSALHGLVAPDRVIEPYEVTLNKMPAGERFKWAEKTYLQIRKKISPGSRIIFLAGKNYRQFLIPLLEENDYSWDAPLSRLRIGKQISFLKNNS